MPEEDEGRFIVTVKAPLGSSIEYTESRLKEVDAVFADYSEIIGSFATIGEDQAGQVSRASILVRMASWEDRDISQAQLMARLRQRFLEIPGVEAFVTEVPMVGGQRGRAPAVRVLVGPVLQRVAGLASELKARLDSMPEMGTLDLDAATEPTPTGNGRFT